MITFMREMPRLLSEAGREQLIIEVKKHPCIWNYEYDTYNVKESRTRAWVQVAKKLECRVEECKTQWKYLKEKFRREDARDKNLKANGLKVASRWRFLELLSYVRPFIKPMPDKSLSSYTNYTDSDFFSESPTLTPAVKPAMSNGSTEEPQDTSDAFPTFMANLPETQAAENLALTSITSFDSNLGKRKISESLQINNAASDSFMETKRPRLEQDITSQATYSFYQSMADEALKLSAVERLKLQVSVIQLHIEAMEKHQNSDKKEEKQTEPPQEPETKTSSDE